MAGAALVVLPPPSGPRLLARSSRVAAFPLSSPRRAVAAAGLAAEGAGVLAGELGGWQREGEEIRLLDLRGYDQYLEGHVPGSAHFDWVAFAAEAAVAGGAGAEAVVWADPEAFAVAMEGKGVGTDGLPVVVYDGGGGDTAAEVWLALTLAGHPRVHVLRGGWAAWEAAGGVTELYEPCPLKAWAEFAGEVIEAGPEEVAEARAELQALAAGPTK